MLKTEESGILTHTHTHNPDMTEGKNMRRTLMQAVIVVSLPACFAHNNDQSVSPHTHLEPPLQLPVTYY